MPRFNERAQITRADLERYAQALRRIAESHEQIAKNMAEAGLDRIDPTHVKTAVDGMVSLNKFLGASLTAYCDQVSALGVEGIEGAREEIERLTGRATSSLSTGRIAQTLVRAEKKREKRGK